MSIIHIFIMIIKFNYCLLNFNLNLVLAFLIVYQEIHQLFFKYLEELYTHKEIVI